MRTVDAGTATVPVIPESIAELVGSVPALALAHRLADAEIEALAAHWERAGASPAASPQLNALVRAAHRLRELRVEERRMRTCPVCGFDDLARPPYGAFEEAPEDLATLEPPYAVHLGDPSGEQCARCGYRFGWHDDPTDGTAPITFDGWHRSWIERGSPWFDGSRPPG